MRSCKTTDKVKLYVSSRCNFKFVQVEFSISDLSHYSVKKKHHGLTVNTCFGAQKHLETSPGVMTRPAAGRLSVMSAIMIIIIASF